MSIRLPDDIRDKLDQLALQQDRSVGYLINTAVKRLVEDHEAHLAIVDEGIADLDAGRIVDHDEVMRRGAAVIAKYTSRS